MMRMSKMTCNKRIMRYHIKRLLATLFRMNTKTSLTETSCVTFRTCFPAMMANSAFPDLSTCLIDHNTFAMDQVSSLFVTGTVPTPLTKTSTSTCNKFACGTSNNATTRTLIGSISTITCTTLSMKETITIATGILTGMSTGLVMITNREGSIATSTGRC